MCPCRGYMVEGTTKQAFQKGRQTHDTQLENQCFQRCGGKETCQMPQGSHAGKGTCFSLWW